MYERILVPLDGSELAEQALPYAREMATKFKSRLTLLRAITSSEEAFREVAADPITVTAPEMTVGVARNIHDTEASAARDYLRTIAGSFDGSGIEVETQMVEGEPEHVIETQAAELNISLIIMASHGRHGLGRILHGSIADDVVRGSTVPILLIRPTDATNDKK